MIKLIKPYILPIVLFSSVMLSSCTAADPPVASTSPSAIETATDSLTPIQSDPFDLFELPAGLKVTTIPAAFKQPTQFAISDDGETLWVAEINGRENGERGRVTEYQLNDGSSRVILANLDKPTGLLVLDETVWVATRDQILKAALPGPEASLPVSTEVVVNNIPNNGRSNGTLTAAPDGKILYESSGSRSKPTSGQVFALDPNNGESTSVARGLKGGYAHVFDREGNLWLTEIADGSIGGETLPGEINFVSAAGYLAGERANFGWPTCFGRELQGPSCDGTQPAVTILPLNSTPTSITISPFDENALLVPLWVTGEVVRINYRLTEDGNAIGEPLPFITGMSNPQHIITNVDQNGKPTVWLSDYATGQIYQIVEE